MKTTVKITKSCSGVNFSFRQGETHDLEERLANDLIGAGYAEALTPVSNETSETVNTENEEDKITTQPKKSTGTSRKRATKKDE